MHVIKWMKANKIWSGLGTGIIILLLGYLFQNGEKNSPTNMQTFKIDKNNNSPITGSITQQTNNYYMSDSNRAINPAKDNTIPKKRKPKIVKDVTSDSDKSVSANNKQINTKLYIGNMSGGVAVANVENLNVNTIPPLPKLEYQIISENILKDSLFVSEYRFIITPHSFLKQFTVKAYCGSIFGVKLIPDEAVTLMSSLGHGDGCMMTRINNVTGGNFTLTITTRRFEKNINIEYEYE